MSHSLFISDLHLSAAHPLSSERFLHFAEHIAPQTEALYILGDLFEYWAGDDDLDDPFHRTITGTLRKLSEQGIQIYLMHGNRDFLMAGKLARACNATLLNDPTMLDLYGTPTLISHGDALCTDDDDYQAFRRRVRSPGWQQQFLAQPLAQRKKQIEQLRQQSEQEKRLKQMSIMDVNTDTVSALLRDHGYPRLIHGHTHRPARHLHHLDGHNCERWVLGDWDTKANALRCDNSGIKWEIVPD
ncbi:MAG: UDP-2,3-diacylglucosamine diphosphatase [Pseudomonadota bacterium]